MSSLTRFVGSVLTAMAAVSICYGQDQPAPKVRVAVYDFTGPRHYQGHMVGRRAAEAAHALMLGERRWEMVNRAALLRLCAREEASPPFALGYLQMFGEKLEAPLALCGFVENCIVNPERGSAQVTLVSELIETIEGGSLQSITTVASSERAAGETLTLDEVVDQALTQAAEDLVAAIYSFEPLAAPVMADVTEAKVLLDAGTKAGLAPGAKMLAYRRAGDDWVVMGALLVESVTEDISHARVTAQREAIRPNDRAVLVAR
jgi:hypothetical protein